MSYYQRIAVNFILSGCIVGLVAILLTIQEYHVRQCANPANVCVYGDGRVAVGIYDMFFVRNGVGGGVACLEKTDTLRNDLVWATTYTGTLSCYTAQMGIPIAASLCLICWSLASIPLPKEREVAATVLVLFAASAYIICVAITLWFYNHAMLDGMNLPPNATQGQLLTGGYLLIASCLLAGTGTLVCAWSSLRNFAISWRG
jgi:hypothetical protein